MFWKRHFTSNATFFWHLICLVRLTFTLAIYVPAAAAAAAAAKSLQLCPTLCDPIDGSPPGSPVPRILQARTLEWVAISFSNAWKWKVKVKSLSHVPLCDSMDCSHAPPSMQAPPSMGFSRQEYWSGVPLPSPIYVPSIYKLLVLSSLPILCVCVWIILSLVSL